MGSLREEVTITAAPSRVWRIIEKHLENPESSDTVGDPGSIKAGRGMALSSQRSGLGTRTRWSYTYRKKAFVWDDVVTIWEPGKHIEWRTTSTWQMRDSFTLIPQDNGTLLVYDMDYMLPYGVLGSFYGKVILEPRMRKHLRGVLGMMKRIVENPLADSGSQKN